MEKLCRDFYNHNTLCVAKELLGKYLVHNIDGIELAGKIVETEAYIGPEDKAAHSYNNRRTQRNEVMYGPAGYAYIFAIYGMHYCMNVVTSSKDKPSAILIRALEPVTGLDIMSMNRYNKKYDELDKSFKKSMTNGPGKLCQALGINKSNYGDDLCGGRLYITQGESIEYNLISSSPRINIDYAEEAVHFPWRFYVKNNPYVSYPNKYK
jgi:DNA-3-methyladenine glycosylase